MRPVDKGSSPEDFSDYREAAPFLEDRLGRYCNYCERRLETNLAVEHVQPKSREPELARDWDNYLFSCVNCNSSKGDTEVELEQYLWPDRDNTSRAFKYGEAGVISVSDRVSGESGVEAQAKALITLVGLDKVPGSSNPPTDADQRWIRRAEIWVFAIRARTAIRTTDTEETRELAIVAAIGWGGFSIWMDVFEDDEEFRNRLISAFAGTSVECFEPDSTIPIPRPGGAC